MTNFKRKTKPTSSIHVNALHSKPTTDGLIHHVPSIQENREKENIRKDLGRRFFTLLLMWGLPEPLLFCLVHNSRVKSLRAFEPFSSFTSRRDDSCPIFPDSLQSPVRCFPCSLSIGLHLHLYILLQIHRHYFQLYKKRHWEALTFHFHCPMKCVCVTHFVYSATGWEGKDQWLNNSEIIKNKIQNSNKNWIKKELH